MKSTSEETQRTLNELIQGNIIVQGMGAAGKLHTKRMLDFCQTNIVAGVAPGKGGQKAENIPIYENVEEAVAAVGSVSATVIFVPAFAAKDAVIEAVDAKIPLIVWITERVPQQDVSYVKSYIEKFGPKCKLIGPNSPGLVKACRVRLGLLPNYLFKEEGDIAVFSRSGSLSIETTLQLQKAGLKVGLVIGIGGDPIIGTGFVDWLEEVRNDPSIKAVLIAGEIGPPFEQKAARYLVGEIEPGEIWPSLEQKVADYISEPYPKPVLFYIAGTTAPLGRALGHAGARIEKREEATDKVKELEEKGQNICLDILKVGEEMKKLLN